MTWLLSIIFVVLALAFLVGLLALFPERAMRWTMFGKWPGRVMLAHGIYQWAKDRKLREANTGRVLSEKEISALLSPKNTGLLIDGDKGRLSEDASFP